MALMLVHLGFAHGDGGWQGWQVAFGEFASPYLNLQPLAIVEAQVLRCERHNSGSRELQRFQRHNTDGDSALCRYGEERCFEELLCASSNVGDSNVQLNDGQFHVATKRWPVFRLS